MSRITASRFPAAVVTALALLAVLTLAAWMRLVGVAWGLPYLYDLDEPYFVVPAFKVLASRDLNPHWFGHPGTTTIYSNTIAFGLEGARALVAGDIERASNLGQVFWSEPSRFYLIARLVAVLFGVGTVALTYRLARRFLDVPAALAAALLLAVAPLHVEYSQIARTDAQHVFLITLFTLFCVRLAQEKRLTDYVWAGATLGLAIACKYTSVVTTIGLIAAFVVDRRQAVGLTTPWWQPVTLATAACVAGALIGSPYILLDFGQVLQDLRTEGRASHLSATSMGFLPALALYVRTLTVDNFGPAALACALAGLAVWGRAGKATAPLLALLAGYLLFISTLKLQWARWAIPVLPLLCVLLASSLELAGAVLARSAPMRLGLRAASALLITGCAVVALQQSLSSNAERRGEDNRTHANHWIESHIAPGSRLAIERYTPQPDKRRYGVYRAEQDGQLSRDDAPNIHASTSGALASLLDPDALRKAGISHVVLGNTLDRMEAEPLKYAREIATYQRILASATLVYETSPEPGHNRGNHVRIYRLD